MLKSAPVAYESLVLAQSNKSLIAPAMIAAAPNKTVNGNSNCLGSVRFKVRTIGCTRGKLKIRSGAVSMPRNGNTAPMLKISANEARSINTNSKPNCPRRRGLI